MERPLSAADGEEDNSVLPVKTWRQRVRDWRFRPMGLEPTPELAAVAVGASIFTKPLNPARFVLNIITAGCCMEDMVTTCRCKLHTHAAVKGIRTDRRAESCDRTTALCTPQDRLTICIFWCAAYFVQGVKMSLGTLTEQFYLKDDLQFDPAQVVFPQP